MSTTTGVALTARDTTKAAAEVVARDQHPSPGPILRPRKRQFDGHRSRRTAVHVPTPCSVRSNARSCSGRGAGICPNCYRRRLRPCQLRELSSAFSGQLGRPVGKDRLPVVVASVARVDKMTSASAACAPLSEKTQLACDAIDLVCDRRVSAKGPTDSRQRTAPDTDRQAVQESPRSGCISIDRLCGPVKPPAVRRGCQMVVLHLQATAITSSSAGIFLACRRIVR